MTEREAINQLLENYPPNEEYALRVAFDLAINALRITRAEPYESEELTEESLLYCRSGNTLTLIEA